MTSAAETLKGAAMASGAISGGISFFLSASLSLIYGLINMV
jgi:hypothetical protein